MTLKFTLYSQAYQELNDTVKPVLSGHSKIDKTKDLKTNDS